jgi:chemotaxis protein methyltransferase CheR
MSPATPISRVPRPARSASAPRARVTAVGAPDEFLAFCAAVLRLTGIDLLQYKRSQMERRIRTFAERRGALDLDDYLTALRRRDEELDAFLDRITINVSQLWRNPEQWRVIAQELLPALAAGGRLRAWSAGCSYGAEAYTLAALVRDHADRHGALRAEIHGTDIDARMVARAREGRFSAADARDAPLAALRRHFVAEPGGGWRASPALRSDVRFATGDLLRGDVRRDSLDLVLCRNTVIYFTEEVRDAVHARLARALRPGGFLVVGATERVAHAAALGLTSTQPFTYQKTGA